MIMYKLSSISPYSGKQEQINRLSDNACIPFDPDNTDYANFKKEVLEGAELQDADGVVMSADAAKEFVKTLP